MQGFVVYRRIPALHGRPLGKRGDETAVCVCEVQDGCGWEKGMSDPPLDWWG